MQVIYGTGQYREGKQQYRGRIIMGEHRLFLKSPDGDIPATYIPMEKIIRVRRTFSGLTIDVHASAVKHYRVILQSGSAILSALTKDLVQKRHLKKKLLFPEWFDETAGR